MEVNSVEETLNGGYKGLYAEVVEVDIYRLRDVKFTPDIIFDIGSNIGVFTRYAREMFPWAIVISVEPDESNFKNLTKFTNPHNIVFINKAIGVGSVWKSKGAINGAHECYITSGLGYPVEKVIRDHRLEPSEVGTIMPSSLIDEFLFPGMKSILKLDVEGAENAIWEDESSMKALMKIDYIAGEIHEHAIDGEHVDEVVKKTMSSLGRFLATHTVEYDRPNFWLTKK